jgi:hypothetical protein
MMEQYPFSQGIGDPLKVKKEHESHAPFSQ